MEVIQEQIDDLNALLKVRVEPDDYKDKYEESLKTYRKQVNLPGFRQGKVPMGVIKKRYGKSILADEMNRIINNSIYEHITKNDLDVLGNPMPKEGDSEKGDWENPDTFEFTYELGLAPTVEIKLSGKDKFDYYKIQVDDEMLNKQVEDLRRRHGKLTMGESVEESDMVLGQFVELNEDGEPIEGGIMHSSTVSVEFIEDVSTKEKFIGKKVGDDLVIDPKEVSKGEADMAAMLGITKEQLDDVSGTFRFTINEIKRMIMADMDQEFFDKLFGDGEVSSEDELKAKITEDMEKMFQRDSDQLLKREVQDYLIEKAKLDLPDDFLKRWIMASNEKPVTMEQIESEYDAYSKNLRWQLIENKIIKENDMQVQDEEAIGYTKGLIANNYMQYGMPVPEDKELEENAKSVLQNKEEAQRVYEAIYEQKIMEWIKNTVKLKDKEVSYDEFGEIVAKYK